MDTTTNNSQHHIFIPSQNWRSWHQISKWKTGWNLRLATAGRALETLPAMDCLTSPEAARVAAPSMMSAGVSCLQILLALESGLGGVGCGRDSSVFRTGSWLSGLATSDLEQLQQFRDEYNTHSKSHSKLWCNCSICSSDIWFASTCIAKMVFVQVPTLV